MLEALQAWTDKPLTAKRQLGQVEVYELANTRLGSQLCALQVGGTVPRAVLAVGGRTVSRVMIARSLRNVWQGRRVNCSWHLLD